MLPGVWFLLLFQLINKIKLLMSNGGLCGDINSQRARSALITEEAEEFESLCFGGACPLFKAITWDKCWKGNIYIYIITHPLPMIQMRVWWKVDYVCGVCLRYRCLLGDLFLPVRRDFHLLMFKLTVKRPKTLRLAFTWNAWGKCIFHIVSLQ